MSSYVFDIVRSNVPKMTLDKVFENKDMVANAIKDELAHQMPEFGYQILKALVTDISPAENVKRAMNEINAQSRLRAAAVEKAEAEKVVVVKAAEG